MDREDKKETTQQDILEEIGEMIRKTRFGELVITIHDAKIVQIEKKEKKRFNYELPHRWCESKKI